MTTKVINTSSDPRQVKIRRADGSPDTIHLAPKGKVTLAKGQTIDQNWHTLEGEGVKIKSSSPLSQLTSE